MFALGAARHLWAVVATTRMEKKLWPRLLMAGIYFEHAARRQKGKLSSRYVGFFAPENVYIRPSGRADGIVVSGDGAEATGASAHCPEVGVIVRQQNSFRRHSNLHYTFVL